MKTLTLVLLIGSFAMLCPLVSKGQSNSLGDRAESAETKEQQHTHKQKLTRKQKLLFRKPNIKHTAQYEFYARIEQAAKEKQRLLRKLAKEHYFEFKYFGHKSLPKRHLPYAMRYCKECGIRH